MADFRSMTDFRELCAELLEALEYEAGAASGDWAILRVKAGAALAQPEPQGPTFIEVMQLADDFFTFRGNSHGDAFFATEITAKTDPGQALEQFAQAVLARYARPAIEPVSPTDDELDELWAEIDGGGAIWAWQHYDRAVLQRWGRPAIEPVPET